MAENSGLKDSKIAHYFKQNLVKSRNLAIVARFLDIFLSPQP